MTAHLPKQQFTSFSGLSREDLLSYDHYLFMMSFGKDSMASLFHGLNMGIDPLKIELNHHLIDGQYNHFMDWPCTTSFGKQFASVFNLPLYFSWKNGGFKGELFRDDQPTAPTTFEMPEFHTNNHQLNFFDLIDSSVECSIVTKTIGGKGEKGRRMRFPQQSADLKTRWCSSSLKISVCSASICNQERFHNKKILVVTGERAEESNSRSKLSHFQKHTTDTSKYPNSRKKRKVDHARPVHQWQEQDVWNIIKDFKVLSHPAYRLGFSRLSCYTCIFASKNQWATIRKMTPFKFNTIAEYEEQFQCTIDRSKKTIIEQADLGTCYDYDEDLAKISQQTTYNQPILTQNWTLPLGAFGEKAGPPT